MQPPCEIMVSRFLPNIRGIVTHELAEKGQSQRRIAAELGITQARVSHYLSKRKSVYYSELFRSFGTSENELEGYARILGEDVTRNQADGIFTLYSIWKNMLFNGRVCEIHQRDNAVSSDCTVCMILHRPQNEGTKSNNEEDDDYVILRNLSEAVALVEGSLAFTRIMPEVSVNIAMCRAAPTSRSEVAAIPGRINKIHGRAKAFVLPEFGSSNHLSNVLLLINSKVPHVRSVMNLRYDDAIDYSLSSLEIKKVFTSERTISAREHREHVSASDERIIEKLSDVKIPDTISKSQKPFVVIDRGSEGLEPITYLFGSKASEISEISLKIAYLYSAKKD